MGVVFKFFARALRATAKKPPQKILATPLGYVLYRAVAKLLGHTILISCFTDPAGPFLKKSGKTNKLVGVVKCSELVWQKRIN